MKKNMVGMVVAVLAFLSLGNATTVSANTLEAIQEQQEQTQSEIDSLQKEVNTVLEEISVLSIELEDLNAEIGEKEKEIELTESEVAAQEEIVEARLDQARQRLQSLQLNETTQNIVLTILEAESLSDLFNRAIVIMRLTDAGNDQLDLAQEEVQTLVELEDKLKTGQAELAGQLTAAEEQREEFDGKVSSLQALINENQTELTTLIEKEEVEVARIEEARRQAREEAARAEAQRAAEEQAAAEATAQRQAEERAAARATAESKAAEQEVSVSSSDESSAEAAEQPAPAASNSSNNNTSSAPAQSTPAPAPAPSKPAQSSGRTLRVQATGYSTKQPSLSTHTATGIDLRVNSRVIAVDPSVIPLGSMVEVEGMGVYIAGDTGGAIKGNIIDIHFSTVAEALQWGRRSVTIRVLD
ncbi:3D domain-containing protein [Alkalibacterium olivapovliticus]|uniref:Cystine transport system substrate-binding protein n=1 Tax=Alkalibacterium olivapovliticus TaxID=99907 RepID=A0A2T0WAC3_9LACT|nr:3D domain-containing protein [Alkalibacterium olivapovliticus]PRY83653.1 cystine transport system substrate-binding protein [Alkalibacterium olivapovliticus]